MIDDVRAWIGRTETVAGTVGGEQAAMMASLLDRAAPPLVGEPLPPLWHWMLALPTTRQSELGEDGHPRKGGFLPPVALPRRMWAGSRLRFTDMLAVGEPMRRTSSIMSVTSRDGRSGPLVFVQVRHETVGAGGGAVLEEQDIVYKVAQNAPPPASSPPSEIRAADASHRVTIDPILLFRFSAATFNAHRIHYDRDYAMRVEGYPGLVVHGPLTAMLLMELLVREASRAITSFTFRGLAPLFDDSPIELSLRRGEGGVHCELGASDTHGRLGMIASAELEALPTRGVFVDNA